IRIRSGLLVGNLLFSSPRPVLDHVFGQDHVTETVVATDVPPESPTIAVLVPLLPFKLFQLACGTTPATAAGARPRAAPLSLTQKLTPMLAPAGAVEAGPAIS